MSRQGEENLNLPVSDAQRAALAAMLKRDDDVAVIARILLQLIREVREVQRRTHTRDEYAKLHPDTTIRYGTGSL